MRRFLVKALFAFVILAMLAPPGFAQAPAPKVTITGLFDQVTSAGRNTYDGNLTRNSDKEWYARTRFRPDFEFAVGRPFDTLAQYKLAQYANGDFAGISAITTFTPAIKTNLAWVIAEQELAGSTRGLGAGKTTRGSDYALIFSPEVTPFKGLDIKPLYSWWHADGLTQGTARRNLANIRTFNSGTASATIQGPGSRGPATFGDPTEHETRHTIGLDARWRLGPFALDPTVYWQVGRADTHGLDDPGPARQLTAAVRARLSDTSNR